jgi:hypothetical protein
MAFTRLIKSSREKTMKPAISPARLWAIALTVVPIAASAQFVVVNQTGTISVGSGLTPNTFSFAQDTLTSTSVSYQDPIAAYRDASGFNATPVYAKALAQTTISDSSLSIYSISIAGSHLVSQPSYDIYGHQIGMYSYVAPGGSKASVTLDFDVLSATDVNLTYTGKASLSLTRTLNDGSTESITLNPTLALAAGRYSMTSLLDLYALPLGLYQGQGGGPNGGMGLFTLSAAAVPEPGTWALMALGLWGVGMASRRARRSTH